MNETLHNISNPAIPANEGWQEMQALLNTYLPVKKKPAFGKRFLLPVFTVVMTTACLLIAFQLNNLAHFHCPHGVTAGLLPVFQKSKGLVFSFDKNDKPVTHEKKMPGHPDSLPFIADDQLFSAEAPTLVGVRLPAIELIKNVVEKKLSGGSIYQESSLVPIVNHANKNDHKNISAGQSSWNFLAGAGVNITFSSDQNLQPYPVVEARYNLNKHIYLAAGLTAWSPVSAGAAGISKTVYQNDNMNGIMLYNETNMYDHLKYADLPLSVGVNINKNIALQGGIQTSILLSKKTTRLLTGPIASPVAVTARDTPQGYHMGVRPIDYRLIAALRYTMNKTVIGLTYQHGLQTIGNSNYASNNRNHLVSLNLLFRLK